MTNVIRRRFGIHVERQVGQILIGLVKSFGFALAHVDSEAEETDKNNVLEISSRTLKK